MSDAYKVLYAFWQYGNEPPPLSEVGLSFRCIAKTGEGQPLTPLKVTREGDRFFKVTLPDGSAKRYRLVGPRELQEVESIPGGDPPE